MMGVSAALQAVACLLVAVLPVEVTTNTGQTVRGSFEGVSEKTLSLGQDGKVTQWPFDELLSLQQQNVEGKTGPTYRVTLIGGSKIAAQDVVLADSTLVVEPRRQNPLRVPVKAVKSIRFRAPATTTDASWLGLVQAESRGDMMVIRRPSDRLDPVRGIIEAIGDDKVTFNLEGDTVDAPIERLEGVVFGGTDSVVEDTPIQVTDVYGSVWSLIALRPSQGDQPLQMQLTDTIVHELPLDQVMSVRWSGGLVLLASEQPVTSTTQAYFQTGVDGALLESFFGPSPQGDGDLVMHGGSSIEYRIEPGHQTFSATVRRVENIPDAGKVTVRIKFDGKTVWEQDLPDADARGLELPLADSRRLTIEVDSGDDGDLGDTVRISRPRLLK